MPLRRPLLALLLVLASGPAAAQNVSFGEHFDRGVRLSSEGDFRGALTEFHAAYDGSQNPGVLFNLAAAHEALNEYVEARDFIERYQRLAPPEAVARHRADVVAALARLGARIGTLAVATDLPDAALEVDGTARRDWREGVALSVGRHRVVVSAPGREPFRAEVDVLGGARVALAATLARTQSTLLVACDLSGAAVLVDGREVARTPVESPLGLDAGHHVVEVTHPGYEPYRTELDATGVGARVAATLRWSEPVPEREGAHLVVRASEPGAHATLDGRRMPTDGSMTVPPGRHALRVEREEFLTVARAIDLPAGRSTELELRLEPTPAYRAAVLGRSRTMRLGGWVGVGVGGPLLVASAIWLGFAASRYDDSVVDRNAATVGLSTCETAVTPCAPGREMALRSERDAIDARLDGELTAAVISGVLTGVGAAGTVVGVILLANAPPADRFERAPTWYLGVAPRGLSVSGRF